MNFEEWLSRRIQTVESHSVYNILGLLAAWDYQQAKIDELQAEIQKAQEYIDKLEEQRWNKLFNEKG